MHQMQRFRTRVWFFWYNSANQKTYSPLEHFYKDVLPCHVRVEELIDSSNWESTAIGTYAARRL